MSLPPNIIARIANVAPDLETLNALRRANKTSVKKPSQKRVASLVLGTKNLRKKSLSAGNIQKMGYHPNVYPAHILNGKYTEGNNIALLNAARKKAFNKGLIGLNNNLNYYELLNLLANANKTNKNTVQEKLLRNAPRGLKYLRLAGGENVYRSQVKKMRRNQVALPGRVEKRLEKFSKQTPSVIKSEIKKYLTLSGRVEKRLKQTPSVIRKYLTPGGYWKR